MRVSNLVKIITITCGLILLVACGQKSPEELLKSANSFSQSGDFSSAIIELKQAVTASPTNPEIRYELGKAYFASGALDSSAKELELALKYEFKLEDTVLTLAQVYSEQQKSDEVLNLRKNINDLSENANTKLMFYEALALVDIGKNVKAKQTLLSIIEINNGSEYFYLAKAYYQMMNNESDGLLEDIEKSLDIAPNLFDGLWLKANLLKKQQDFEASVLVFRKLSELRPANSQVSMFLADTLMQSNDIINAEPIVSKLISEFPEAAYVNYLAGLIAYSKLNFEEAKLLLEKAIYNGFDNTNGRLIAAFSSYKFGDYEQSYSHLNRIKDKLTSDSPGLRLLLALQLELGLTDQTMKLADSMSFSSDDSEFLSSATLKLLQAGNNETASNVLNKYESLQLTDARNIKKLGLLKLSMGNQEGVSDLETAFELEPDDKSNNNFLAVAYLGENDLTKANNLAKKLQSESPKDILGYNLEAMVYLKQENKESASAIFRKSLDIDEYNPLALNFFAEQAIEKGNQKEAETYYKKMLEKYPNRLEALYAYYNVQKELGDTQQSVTLIAAAQEQSDIRFKLLYANVFVDRKNPEKVIELLKDVKPSKNLPDYFWLAIADSYLQTRNVAKAVDYYSQWATLHPEKYLAHGRHIAIRQVENNIPAALDAIHSAEKIFGKIPEFELPKANFMLLAGDTDGARKVYESIQREFQITPMGKGILGRLLYSQKLYEEALPNLFANYDKTKSPIICGFIVGAYSKMEKPEKAITFLEQHLKDHSSDTLSLNLYAQLLTLSQPQKAIIAYKKLLSLQPNNASASNNLAWLISKTGDHASALEYARKATKLQPNEASYLDTLGMIQLKSGRVKEGEGSLEKAHRLAPDSTGIWLNYIDSLILGDKKQQASKEISQMESKHTENNDVMTRLSALSKRL